MNMQWLPYNKLSKRADIELQKQVMRNCYPFIMELENMFLRIQEMVFGGQMQLKLFLAD